MADNFSFHLEGLEEFRSDIKKGSQDFVREIMKAMIQSTETVKNSAQRLAPFKTGNLRRSIFTEIHDNGVRGDIGVDPHMASYGAAVEFGTKPHTIVAVNKRALFWKGALHPVRSVRHPGSKAKPFLEPSLIGSRDAIIQFFGDAVTRILEKMAGKRK